MSQRQEHRRSSGIEAAAGRVGAGDVLLATANDRVACDPLDLVHILKVIQKAGARLRLVDEPFSEPRREWPT